MYLFRVCDIAISDGLLIMLALVPTSGETAVVRLELNHFIIHPCDPTVVICYLIWPCDIDVHITYLISHSSSLSYNTVIKGYFKLGV